MFEVETKSFSSLAAVRLLINLSRVELKGLKNGTTFAK
jgi:hypothetical protein